MDVHPAVALAEKAAEDLLPGAAAADDPARGVGLATLRDLADQGLYSAAVAVEDGGLGGDERTLAEVEEHLAGADGATWFVLTQHRTPQKLTLDVTGDGSGGPAALTYRDTLARGDALGGIAIAHLRRPGPPPVRAERDGTGWRITGHADWCTGWDLIDLVLLAAVTTDERVVFALLPARDRPGLRSEPYALSVMGGTRTVALDIDDLVVDASEVAAVVDLATWRARDAATVLDTKPATLGLLRRVIAETDRIGRERDRPAAVEAAAELAALAAPLRERAYALRFADDRDDHADERLALRGRHADLAVRAAAGLVAARGGSAMVAEAHEQRWLREAGFHLVQAQTEAVRSAQLAALRRTAPWSG
jgi:alkylation response protein AidB-like acyl-CoA dehydrogenase